MMWSVEYHSDSFVALKDLPDNSADVIITDPPYSEHVHGNLCSGSLVGTKNVPKYDLTFEPLTQYEWLKDCLRVSKRWVVVFCALDFEPCGTCGYDHEYEWPFAEKEIKDAHLVAGEVPSDYEDVG